MAAEDLIIGKDVVQALLEQYQNLCLSESRFKVISQDELLKKVYISVKRKQWRIILTKIGLEKDVKNIENQIRSQYPPRRVWWEL